MMQSSGSLSVYIMTNTLTSWQHQERWRFKFPPLVIKQYYQEVEDEPVIQPQWQGTGLVGSMITLS